MIMQEIINFRESRGINQLTFATKIGVTAACAGQHEKGIAKNHIKYIEKVNRAFGTSFPLVKSCFLCGNDFIPKGHKTGSGKFCPDCGRKKAEEEKRKIEVKGTLKGVAMIAAKNGQSYGNFVAKTGVLLPSQRAGRAKGKYKTPAPEYLCLGRTIKI